MTAPDERDFACRHHGPCPDRAGPFPSWRRDRATKPTSKPGPLARSRPTTQRSTAMATPKPKPVTAAPVPDPICTPFDAVHPTSDLSIAVRYAGTDPIEEWIDVSAQDGRGPWLLASLPRQAFLDGVHWAAHTVAEGVVTYGGLAPYHDDPDAAA